MFSSIRSYCDNCVEEFNTIPLVRKKLLEQISTYIRTNLHQNKPVNLVYICTHNSRRSHFGQVWAKVASNYFQIKNVTTFSGGTEATAFNSNAINALQRIGFDIKPLSNDKNPVYHVSYDMNEQAIECFSKVYNNAVNPQRDSVAIMTCSDAEENCPFIPGVDLRIGTTYEDPKAFDGTPLQDDKYDERCKQIAIETLYVFSKI